MSEKADARRLKMLQDLQSEESGLELSECARRYGADERSIRRDVDFLQQLIQSVSTIEIRRGRVVVSCREQGEGYFAQQLDRNTVLKELIAKAVVADIPDNFAIAITAGTTNYQIAREIHRSQLMEGKPAGLIAFTNSLPVLLELISAGVSTGVLGEVYNSEDRAFHSHEYSSLFQPARVLVGASGIILMPETGAIELCSHRAEEAGFLKQLISRSPEIIIAADASKLGIRHPWAFTSPEILAGKSLRLYTSALNETQRKVLDVMKNRNNFSFDYIETLDNNI
jgi:DeoR/GlpR family transcriptional regulator of sugar metabolism